jgi:O-antigen/teichoic acid export membrane protein/glycosyltransferase involved in cell wall biosynthesis
MNVEQTSRPRTATVDVSESQYGPFLHAVYDRPNDRHLRTDHLLADLKSRTVSSGFITLTSQGIQFALTLGSTMILARLLTPADFGLVAMVFTIMSFLRVFREAGLSTATVQREGITDAQVSNLFWINVAVGGLTTLLVAAAAPLIAWFYHEPHLIKITIALSISFLLAGSAVQHMALLNRQMRFKAIAVIQVGSVSAGILAGLVMAWLKFGYWSLVGLNLATSAVALLTTWTAARWRPRFFKRQSGTRPLLHFGANLTAGTLVYSLARGLDSLLIGRWYGAFSVGLYSRASALLARPMEQFIGPIEAVFIPALSRLQNQPERYRRIYVQVFETIALASFFFTGMFFALAHPLTLVVLGPKWEEATIIFAGLSFAALQFPLGSCASWLFTSQGRGRESLVASVIISIIIAGSFMAGLPYGPAGVAIAFSGSCLLIQMPLYYWLAGRSGPVGTGDLWFGFLKHLPVWGVVTLVTWLTRISIPDDQPFKELLLAAPAGFIAGIAFIIIYPPSRRRAVSLFSMVRELKNPLQSPIAGQSGNRADEGSQDSAMAGITVVIPTFNRAHLIGRAIESVLKQTFKPSQIIVVDDGSTDGTREVCGKYAGAIEYVHQANGGVSQARNHGIQLARHEWVAFLDSDDYWTPVHLERTAAAIAETAGQASFYFTDMQIPDGAGGVTLWSKIGFTFTKPFLPNRDGTGWMLAFRQPSSIQASVFNTAVLKVVGGFDRRFRTMEDTELFCRLGIGGCVCAVNTVGCIHTPDDEENRLTVKVHCYTENYWRQNSLLWSTLCLRFPDLPPIYRQTIRRNLADAYWRLARLGLRTGQIPLCASSLLRMALGYPPFVFDLVRYRKSPGFKRQNSAGWGNDLLTESMAANAPGVGRVAGKPA